VSRRSPADGCAAQRRTAQRRTAQRGTACQALVGHQAQGVQVSGRRPAAASGPVRRQAGGTSGTEAGCWRLPGRRAEVGDLQHVIRAQQQGFRPDVAVHQARPVHSVQPGRRLRDQVHDRGRLQRAAGQDCGERRPVHELHHHEGRLGSVRLRPARPVVVVDPGDVLVGQQPGVPGGGPESGHLRGVGGDPRRAAA